MSLVNGAPADRDRLRKLSTAELEGEIGASRRRIGLTLDALAQRLAPRRLLQQGMEMVSRFVGTAGRKGSGAGTGLRLDPLALGLVGAGIAWLLFENIGRRRRQTKRRADTSTAVGRNSTTDFGGPSGGQAQAPAEPPSGMIETHPLLLGLAGLALGAALAAVLPSSHGEQEAIARAREDLWQKAEALGHRAASRIRDAGRSPTPTPAAPSSRGFAQK